LQASNLIKIKYARHKCPVIQDLAVDIGSTIERLKPTAPGGRVLSAIPAPKRRAGFCGTSGSRSQSKRDDEVRCARGQTTGGMGLKLTRAR